MKSNGCDTIQGYQEPGAKRYIESSSTNILQKTCQAISSYQASFALDWRGICIAIGILFLSASCSRRYSDLPAYSPVIFDGDENKSVGRFKTSFLAEQIDNYYRGATPGPIGITTFVNLDDLYTTSSFGRMVGEQLISELAMRGYDVVELRQADALQFVTNRGEFGLSRELPVLKRERQLGAVVVGTYVVSPIRVYVNARLVDPSTSLVLSAGSVEMSKTDELTRLLRGSNSFPTLERIPVRQLGFSTYPAWPSTGGFDPLESPGAEARAAREDFRAAPPGHGDEVPTARFPESPSSAVGPRKP